MYLIPNSLSVDIEEVIVKIESSSLIKKGLKILIESKLKDINEDTFFRTTERISDLAIVKYNLESFEHFKENIKPLLVKICEEFIARNC